MAQTTCFASFGPVLVVVAHLDPSRHVSRSLQAIYDIKH
jgi:hypothetical protein